MVPSALRLYKKVILPSQILGAAFVAYSSHRNLDQVSSATPTIQPIEFALLLGANAQM